MRIITTVIAALVLTAATAFAAGGQLTIIPTPEKPHDYLARYTEPAAHGEAAVTLWKDDLEAAYTVGIDGNWIMDHAFWLEMNNTYGINFTFFLVGLAIDDVMSWSRWDSVRVLKEAGNCIGSHSAYHNPYDLHEDGTLNLYIEYHDAKDTIETRMRQWFPDYVCHSFAAPGGGWPNDVDSIQMFYNVHRRDGEMTLSSSSGIAQGGFIDAILDTSGSDYRGWANFVSHVVTNNPDYEGDVRATMQKASENRDRLWVARFDDIGMYSQERQTHELTVTSSTADEIRFTLSDDMHDTIFTYPLTVKVCVNSDWDNLTATQGGSAIDWFFTVENGRQYALVKAVPDRGEVILAKTAAVQAETPIISPDRGSFRDQVAVSVACATSGAEIRYTTDGSLPTSSSTLYAGPFDLTETALVQARAFKSGLTASGTDSVTLTVLPDTVKPQVTTVTVTSLMTEVVICFDEVVTAATAENTANYSLTGGIAIESAELLGNGMAVTLTTSSRSAGNLYDLTVSGIQDPSGNEMDSVTTGFVRTDELPEAGLTGYWSFDDGASITAAADQSGNGNTGVFYGGASVAAGTLGYALQLDGDDDYMNIGPSRFGWNETNALTVAFWFKSTGSWLGNFFNTNNYTKPINIYPNTGRGSIKIYSRSSTDGTSVFTTAKTDIADSTWYHFALTWKDSTQTVYFNGIEDIVKIKPGTPVTTSGVDDIVGKQFTGLIDELRVYNRALSAAEVLALTTGSAQSVTATPVISPDGGTYTDSVTVSIACATAGAAVYYTTDGSQPDSSATAYTGAFTLNSTGTVKAIAYAAGSLESGTASAAFTIEPGSGIIIHAPGATAPGADAIYFNSSGQRIDIRTAPAGIYLRHDGNGITKTVIIK